MSIYAIFPKGYQLKNTWDVVTYQEDYESTEDISTKFVVVENYISTEAHINEINEFSLSANSKKNTELLSWIKDNITLKIYEQEGLFNIASEMKGNTNGNKPTVSEMKKKK